MTKEKSRVARIVIIGEKVIVDLIMFQLKILIVVKILGGVILKFGKTKLKQKIKDVIFKEVQSFYSFGFEDCQNKQPKKSVDELKALWEQNIKKREKQ